MGQHDVGRRSSRRRRRRHAGVHERALAWILRDHEGSASRGTRLHPAGCEGERQGGDRQSSIRPALLQGRKRSRQASWPGRRVRTRSWTSRLLASLPIRSTKVPAKGSDGRCSCRTGVAAARSSTCARPRDQQARTGIVRNEVRQLDATMPVYQMKTLERQLDETLLTDRLIALLSAGFGLLATCSRRLASTA